MGEKRWWYPKPGMSLLLLVPALLLLLVLVATAGCAGSSQEEEPDYWPTEGWRTSTPEEQGMSSPALAAMLHQVRASGLGLHSLLVVRNGYLVTEAYFDPYGPEQPHQTASVTKSVIGALTGLAIGDGYLEGVEEKILPFFEEPEIANLDDDKRQITLEHLLTMTSCLDYDDLSGFRASQWMEQSDDWVDFALDLPVAGRPGARFAYSSASPHLVSAVLQRATGKSAREYANERLFEPLGIAAMTDERWGSDPTGTTLGGYGLYLTPREMAKLGYLYLQNGRWEGEQLLPAGWVTASSTRHTTKDDGYGYGYLWTVDDERGSFAALGRAGQEIHVLPQHDLVVVFTAALPGGQNQDFELLKTLLEKHILPAVKGDEPLPPNPEGARELRGQLELARHPREPVQEMPPVARQVSGKTFELQANPMDWSTISFSFSPGEPEARVSLDGLPLEPPIGLDNIYRVGQAAPEEPLTGMKGQWTAQNRFLVRQSLLGEFDEIEFEVTFEERAVSIVATNAVTGQQQTVAGSLVE